MTGDGKLDLVVANRSSSTVSVLVGNGNGTFQPKVDYSTAALPVAMAVAEVTGDGAPDIVVASDATSTVSVLIATCLP